MMLAQDVSQLSIGVVSELHPKLLGRVKVRFPHLDNTESDWCFVVSPMAGDQCGLAMIPEVGDHVLVGFEQGSMERGFILGGLWNEKKKAPTVEGDLTKNNWRFMQSRSGHVIRLDDTKGAEQIVVLSSNQKQSIVIDVAKNKMNITSESGDVSITAKSGEVTIQATSIKLKSKGNMAIEAGGMLTLKGSTVNIN